jgi:hypothetical protein
MWGYFYIETFHPAYPVDSELSVSFNPENPQDAILSQGMRQDDGQLNRGYHVGGADGLFSMPGNDGFS